MQIASTIRRRSIGRGASVPYTSHPFWLPVPTMGGVGRLPATTPKPTASTELPLTQPPPPPTTHGRRRHGFLALSLALSRAST
jgi:hypothetical protein